MLSFTRKKEKFEVFDINDTQIVAMQDGYAIDITAVKDSVFSKKLMGDGIAFQYEKKKITLCSPCNGKLTVMFPTGHAFGITMNNGVELLIHIGIDTVKSQGKGFKILKKQGETLQAGEPVVVVDVKELSKSYDMTTMLIITNSEGNEFCFIDEQSVVRGQDILKEVHSNGKI